MEISMATSYKSPAKKYKLSALERVLLQKMRKSKKSSWMVDAVCNN